MALIPVFYLPSCLKLFVTSACFDFSKITVQNFVYSSLTFSSFTRQTARAWFTFLADRRFRCTTGKEEGETSTGAEYYVPNLQCQKAPNSYKQLHRGAGANLRSCDSIRRPTWKSKFQFIERQYSPRNEIGFSVTFLLVITWKNKLSVKRRYYFHSYSHNSLHALAHNRFLNALAPDIGIKLKFCGWDPYIKLKLCTEFHEDWTNHLASRALNI